MRLRLPQKCVYWASGRGADGFGKPKLATPVELRCRWVDGVTETLGPQGDKVLSSATIYLDTPVQVGGLLRLGLLTEVQASSYPVNPREDRRVHEILNVGTTPNTHATQTLTTVSIK